LGKTRDELTSQGKNGQNEQKLHLQVFLIFFKELELELDWQFIKLKYYLYLRFAPPTTVGQKIAGD
jgi:hypothetical protein